MKKILRLIIAVSSILLFSMKTMALTGNTVIHDPSNIIKEGSSYYIFSTGKGINLHHSTDLYNWTHSTTTVFPINKWPEWIDEAVPSFKGDFWAPEIIFMNNKYYLYYSCSIMYSTQSAIGVASSPTLNPDRADYKWTDHGMVVSSKTIDDVNAIDPAIFKDDDGKVYLVYGSYTSGIGIIELDTGSGKIKKDAILMKVAGGAGVSVEASYLIKEGKYYYLFTNRATCCKDIHSTYYISVGRSVNVGGPYFDRNGNNLKNINGTTGGTTVLNTSGRYMGPGHLGLFKENSRNIVSMHYYDGDDKGIYKLDLAELQFTEGWPVITRNLIPKGRYTLKNRGGDFVLGTTNPSAPRPQPALLDSMRQSAFQTWNLTPVGEGIYQIKNVGRNEVLDVPGCSSTNNTPLQTWDWLNNNCQKFKIDQLADGAYVFSSSADLNVVKVIEAPIVTAGGSITITDFNGSSNQKWQISPVDEVPEALGASTLSTSFTARWRKTRNAKGYLLDVSTSSTFTNSKEDVLAEWNFEAGTDRAYKGTTANIERTITTNGTTIAVYNAAGNNGHTAQAKGWDSGDRSKYWQVAINTTGYYQIRVSSKQRSSNTGPRHFKLQYKISSSDDFKDVLAGVATNSDNYANGALTNLLLPDECNNRQTLYLRWFMANTTSVIDFTVTDEGENNIDDIVIKGKEGAFLNGYQNFFVTDTFKVVTGLKSFNNYYYRIRAIEASDTSKFSNTVAVPYTGIRAFKVNNDAKVEWDILGEADIKQYEVERSTNSYQYKKVGSVQAKGITNAMLSYNWLDVNVPEGSYYYRIKSIENSSAFNYSDVAIVTIGDEQTGEIFIYPNPVVNRNITFQVNNIPEGNNLLVITSSNGQIIYKKEIFHFDFSGAVPIQVQQNVPPGIYFLMVFNGEKKQVQRLLFK